MKKIKDAVIELGGKLPLEPHPDSKLSDYGGTYYIYEDDVRVKLINGSIAYNEKVCSVAEYKAEAKRLGYINGYRWGVEYPTNGKRPDLDDDFLIELRVGGSDFFNIKGVFNILCSQGFFDRPAATAFRVIDQRYKPADTSYLNASTQGQSLTHSEEGLTHGEWWDCENDKAIKLPPVGADCELKSGSLDEWYSGTCVAHHANGAVAIFEMSKEYPFRVPFAGFERKRIRPLDHATRKAELKREKVIEAAIKVSSGGLVKEVYSALYDAGMLVLPPKKSDTKD